MIIVCDFMLLKVDYCVVAWASLENVRTDIKLLKLLETIYIASIKGASKTLAKVVLWLSISGCFWCLHNCNHDVMVSEFHLFS